MEVRGSELIGKKEVLDALDETAKAVTVGLDTKSNLFCLINATIDIAKCMVLKLPDARYNTDVGELISRESAVSTVWNALNKNDACKELRALPSITPTIQPEIVRCEECLYRKICSWEKQGAKFCSYAERRGDELQKTSNDE